MEIKPERVQLSRLSGWRMPPNTVKVDRTTRFGNPFVGGVDGTHAQCVDNYRKLIAGPAPPVGYTAELAEARSYILAHLHELRGKNLACWCELGQPCHADILLGLANGETGNSV